MNSNLSDLAISQALSGKWQEAIDINKEIIKSDPEDIEALNRLSRAFFEVGNIEDAKKTANKVLRIEPQNSIATKALVKYSLKYKSSKTKTSVTNQHTNLNTSDFIEEAGTSKHTELLNICSKELILTLSPGDELILLAHSHKVSVTTQNNKYIGKIPDNLAAKLRQLTKFGYRFKIIVKSVEEKCIRIIIKETKRGKGYEGKKAFINESLES